MPDAFVYFFLVRDRTSGKLVTSKRRATLGAIKNNGEALMESQMAVDASEVDAAGFLVSRSVGGSGPTDELWGDPFAESARRFARTRGEATERRRG